MTKYIPSRYQLVKALVVEKLFNLAFYISSGDLLDVIDECVMDPTGSDYGEGLEWQ